MSAAYFFLFILFLVSAFCTQTQGTQELLSRGGFHTFRVEKLGFVLLLTGLSPMLKFSAQKIEKFLK